MKRWLIILLMLTCFLLSACRLSPSEELPPVVVNLPSPTPEPTVTVISPTPVDVPITYTAEAIAEIPSPTSANISLDVISSTRAPIPTNTATITPTVPPTATLEAVPSSTATISVSPTITVTTTPDYPRSGINLLPNSSFEEGWYNRNSVPELQVPNRWTLDWQEGPNSLDPDPWNAYVRPESRVLNGDFLPAHEHSTFIWDGEHTVKIFKQAGSIHFWLTTIVDLQPGAYVLEISFFPDLIDDYNEDGSKIWAPDPLSGEVRFIVGGPTGSWIFPDFGRRSTLQNRFEIHTPTLVRVGAAFRGRWAIENNGWFLDDWSLERIGDVPSLQETPTPEQ